MAAKHAKYKGDETLDRLLAESGNPLDAAGVRDLLAGVLAASTPLPVLGVPINSGALQGLDALLATVQMPSGIPVGTLAIDGSKNAALLAVQILATSDEALHERLIQYKQAMVEQVEAKNARVQAEMNT